MKGKCKLTQRILSLMMVFAMVMGMIIEPVQIYAEQPGRGTETEQNTVAPVAQAGETEVPGEGETTPGGGSGEEVQPPAPEETSITLNVSQLNLTVKDNATITATVSPDTKATEIGWNSSLPEVATVEAVNGNPAQATVTALGAGNTTITAEVDGKTAVVDVTVTPKNHTVDGTVISASNYVGVEGVTVSIEGYDDAVTNNEGQYSMTLPEGTHQVKLTREGFKDQEGTIILNTDGTVTGADFNMSLKNVFVNISPPMLYVGGSATATVKGELDDYRIIWPENTDESAEANGSTVTGKKAGKFDVKPTVVSERYGEVAVDNYQGVDVKASPTTVSVSATIDNSRKKMTLTAEVQSSKNDSHPTGGKVTFKITRKDELPDENIVEASLDEKGEVTTTVTKDIGKFRSNYVVTATYEGITGCYLGSKEECEALPESQVEETLKYYDEENGKEKTFSKEIPLKLVYGEEKYIWIDNSKKNIINEVYTGNPQTVMIVKVKEGAERTKFKITTQKVNPDDSVEKIIFVQKDAAKPEKVVGYGNAYFEVTPKEINIDVENSSMTYSKIYDNSRKVFENDNSEDDINLERLVLEGVLNNENVIVDSTYVEEFDGTLPEDFPLNKTANASTKIMFQQSQLKLEGTHAANYTLAEKEVIIPATVTINARKAKITVSDATRSYGHAYGNGSGNAPDYNFTSFESGDWLEVEKETEITGITGILEKDYKELDSSKALKEEQTGGNTAMPEEYPGVLSVDTTQISNYENYIFEIVKGQLTINKEKIPTDVENLSDYIVLENDPNNPSMYFDGAKKLWVKSKGGKLKLSAKTQKLYDTVQLLKIDGNTENVSLTDGYIFNDEKKSGEVTLTLKLTKTNQKGAESEERAESEEFQYPIYLDNTIPKVEFSSVKEGESTPLEQLTEKVTFGAFDKTKYTVQVKVSETDNTSGLKEWTYMVLPLNKDMILNSEEPDEELLAYIETLKDSGEYVWQPMSTSNEPTQIEIASKKAEDKNFVANNYVVLVKPYDNVTNSKIYTSLGIILDNNDPYVELDLAQGQEYKEVYASDVQLQATVKDTLTYDKDTEQVITPKDKSVSGLKEVYYQIAVGEKNLETAEKTSLYKVTDGKHYTLGELRDEKFSGDIKVAANDWNSNDIWVRVTAVDNSGNEFYAYKQLKIDTKNPEVTVEYETKATEDYAPYYKEDRTAVVTVKERNIDYNKLLFVLLKGESEEEYMLSALKEIDGITVESATDSQETDEQAQYTDNRTITVKIRFHGDNKYKLGVKCTDAAGNASNELQEKDFYIDKTPPVLNVSYTSEGKNIVVPLEEAQRLYKGKSISVSLEIFEHNFAAKGEDVQIDVDVKATKIGKNETIPDYNAQAKVNSKWGTNGDSHTTTYTFNSDANYTHSITYTDLAGNTVSYGPGYFTIDKTQPTGRVEIKGFGFWESLLEKITFGLFSPSSVDVVVTGTDHTSPVNPVQFARFYDQMTRDELENYNGWSFASAETPGQTSFSVKPDEQFVVYTKVTDYAGNYQFFSSNGMIVDSTKPAPTVTITNLTQAQNGIFNEDVTLRIDVEDPTAGDTYSGLETVWYNVSATGNVNKGETIKLLNNSTKVQGNKTFSQTITIPSDVYNSNDVKVQAFATDFSGNKGKSEVTELKIDVTKPSISVSWDLNNPLNGRYYKDTRTATVTVTDRNFDPNNVRFNITNTDGTPANIGGWSSSSNIGVSDTATSTCQVSFPADGDYTFTRGCTDLAGNSGEYGQTDEFTIDKIVPVMTVSYDNNDAKNGNYFKETRTATITVREHNFNAADVRAAITASLEGRGISAPSVGAFSGSGDTHTATVSYSTDGDYTFDIDYADMAGNAAADYTQDSFTVDLTVPELEITDVEDKSANNDAVSPKVEATDVNYDAKGVTVTLIGANNGEVEIGTVVSAIENGQSMKFNDFERTEEMDDLYKMTAKAVDKAGNETEKEIMFSVNRYGSVFILDDDTKDWLKTGDAGYTYIKEEKEVGIREINVDAIESRSITVNRDGDLQNLKENTDFTVKNSGSDAQWKEAHYILDKENFAEEGNYTVILNTKDKAKNNMNNTSVKKANKNLPIEFAVDKTAPTVVVSGVEDDAQYRAAERIMTVDAKDNLALTKVTVDIDGTETVYEGEELLKDNGVIETAVESANRWQNIEITAEDAAGNILGQSEETMKGDPVVLRVLVTPNIMIQYFMNKPIFYGSIAAVVAMTGLIIFLIWKKRKDDEERSAGK